MSIYLFIVRFPSNIIMLFCEVSEYAILTIIYFVQLIESTLDSNKNISDYVYIYI